MANSEPPPDQTKSRGVKCCINRMSERETVAELPWAADCYPRVEKLRTVLTMNCMGGGGVTTGRWG
jgi:hypothetical protein